MSTSWQRRLTERLRQVEAAGLKRQRRVVEPLAGGRCRVESRELFDFSNNDYLGLSRHPEVIAATEQAARNRGVGARASMLVSGWTQEHQRLCDSLAAFEDVESVMLFPSGYAACMGTVAALVEPEDVIFCDKRNHACLVDGCRLSGGRLRIYRQERLETLERELGKGTDSANSSATDLQQSRPGTRWIITETVFGMDGIQADLPALLRLAEQYDAFLICDEAHASGVYGPGGRGLVAEIAARHPDLQGLIQKRIAARMGTLSKALGSQGGFVAGARELTDWLWNAARPAMFSTGLSVVNAAAARAAVEILQQDATLTLRLRERSQHVRHRLQELGLVTLGEPDCPIIPIILQEAGETLRAAAALEQAGFLVGAIRPPTVPHGTARLRISLNLAQPESAIEELIYHLARILSPGATQGVLA